MSIVYTILVITLLSLIIPAWEVSRRSDPAFKSKGMKNSFQLWLLGGFFWLCLSYFVNIFVMLMYILGGTNPLMGFLEKIHYAILFLAWPVHAAVGGIAWLTHSKKNPERWWVYLFFIFNAAFIIFICFSGNRGSIFFLGIVLLLVWMFSFYASIRRFKSHKDVISLFLVVGSGLGGFGGCLWFIGRFFSHALKQYGIHIWVSAGIIGIAIGLVMYVLKKITGTNVYSRVVCYVMLIVLCIWGSGTFLNMDGRPSAWGTVFSVGASFVGIFIGIIIWMAFDTLKEKNIDELSAKWVSLGSWMPTGVTAQFISFGGWCFFIGSILLFFSSFQTTASLLFPTLWREGLIKILVIGGAGSFYIASAYCAWGEKASAPDNYIAEVGYWHFFGGSIVMWICYLVSGLVLASQKVFAVYVHKCIAVDSTLQGSVAVTKIISETMEYMSIIGQRPFLIGIAVAHIIVFASILILGINLFRARSK